MASKGNKNNLSKKSSVDDILDKYDRTKVGSVAYEKIKNAEPESLTSITRRQLLTPNKKLQEIEKSKKDFNFTLEQARLKADKTRKSGEAADNNNPDVIAYKKLLNQQPLSQIEQRNINNTKEAMDPTNIALTAGGALAGGVAIKYGLQYGKPLLQNIPFGSLLKYGGKEAVKQGTKQIVKEAVKQGTKKTALQKLTEHVVGLESKALSQANKKISTKGIKESILKLNPNIQKEILKRNLKKEAANVAKEDMKKEFGKLITRK
jgi:hypothetical protein